MRRTPVLACIALLCAPFLAGCADGDKARIELAPKVSIGRTSPQVITATRVQHLKTPPALRTCAVQPAIPKANATDRDFALFVQGSLAAGADCRDKMQRRNVLEDQEAP